jgi:AraC-like DNA-binding protein
MRELTVAAGYVRAFLDFAASRGADRSSLLERSAIASEELSDRDNRIALTKYVALTRAGSELSDDPALSLHFGERVDLSDVSIACTVSAQGSIDETISQLNRYTSIGIEVESAGNGPRWQLKRSGGKLWFVDCRRNANDFPELSEAGFAQLVCSMRRTFREVRFLKEVHFTHTAPAYRAEYDRIFQVPVVFEARQNAIQFDEISIAGVGRPSSSLYTQGILKDHAETLLQNLARSKSTRSRVERMLTPILKERAANAQTIARALGLSRQTLFRRLKNEGVTFEQVLRELRHSLASHYLKENKRSVKETAYLLGFSDPASFSRAYKRWTGTSPRSLSRTSAPQQDQTALSRVR